MKTLEEIPGAKLNPEQKNYLEGFLAGAQQRDVAFADLVAAPMVAEPEEDVVLTTEERIKSEEHPLDSYYRLVENAAFDKEPDKEEIFRFKWNGLFFLSPVKDAFMARLRIPGGQLKAFQMRELAKVAKDLTTGYVQVTTRANLQMRLIKPKDAPAVLRRIQGVGLHTRGAGGDNIRNLTCNPTAGVDSLELIDCTDIVNELADFILSHRDFYDMPRKFNVAFDGGGLIGAVEDTNDIGVKAVKVGDEVVFRICVGGATGHQAFARDLGVEVRPDQILKVVVALIRVFITHGNRGNRKKARLKHLLDTWSLEKYLGEAEKLLGFILPRTAPGEMTYPSQDVPHSHIGAYPQRQKGLYYVGVSLPAGQITPRQMLRLADLADNYGSGEIRLTVWQNFIIPNIPEAYLATVRKVISRMGLGTTQSHVASGVIACTGNRYCKYAATDTKGHAMDLTKYLEKHVVLDQPVNIHITGCPHSCAQHYMGDIGLLGAKTRDGGEAYHVLVGGGFGRSAACGRQIFQAMPYDELKPVIARILKVYMDRRENNESFQTFTSRHDLNMLQVLFCDGP